MTFGEKVKLLRKRIRLTQAGLAEKLDVTTRSVIYYEQDERQPTDAILEKMAIVLNTPVDILTDERRTIELTKEERFIQKAKTEDKKRGKSEAERFLDKCRVFFAGGSIPEEDMDLVFESLTEIFFDAKRQAKEKYGRKKPDDNNKNR